MSKVTVVVENGGERRRSEPKVSDRYINEQRRRVKRYEWTIIGPNQLGLRDGNGLVDFHRPLFVCWRTTTECRLSTGV